MVADIVLIAWFVMIFTVTLLRDKSGTGVVSTFIGIGIWIALVWWAGAWDSLAQ